MEDKQIFDQIDKDVNETLDDRRTIRMVRSFMFKSQEYRREHLELADRSRERYVNWEITEKSRIRRANLKPSYGFTVIETLVPQICDLFLGDDHIIKFKGIEMQDFAFEDPMSDFVSVQLKDMQFESKFIVFIKNMSLDGTAVAKTPYRYKEIETVKREAKQDPITGEVYRTKTPSIEVCYDGPDMENIALYDFFPDWQVKEPGCIEKMRGCVHRMYKSLTDLKQLEKKKLPDGTEVGIYKNLDDVKKSMTTRGDKAWSPPYWEDNYKQSFDRRDGNEKGIKDSDKFEVWEYWGLHDPKGDGNLQEYIITIANGDVIIREEENFYDYKFKPFVACVNYARSNEFYGIPELAVIDSEIREATAIRNARLDQINLSVNSMWVVDRAGGIDTKNLYSRPGGIIYANDINSIKRLDPSDPSQSSAVELASIEQNIGQATAIGSAPVVGGSKSFGRSATGVNYLQQFASSRIGLKGKLLSSLFFQNFTRNIMMINAQFVTDDQWLRISNPDSPNPFAVLPVTAFTRNFDYMIKPKFELPDEVQFQKMQSVAQVLQTAEQTQPGSVKMEVVIEALLRPLIGASVKKFMRTPEELQALKVENAQLRVQEQAANAQIGASAPQPNAGASGSGNFNPVY
jgi:hypothetical protein